MSKSVRLVFVGGPADGQARVADEDYGVVEVAFLPGAIGHKPGCTYSAQEITASICQYTLREIKTPNGRTSCFMAPSEMHTCDALTHLLKSHAEHKRLTQELDPYIYDRLKRHISRKTSREHETQAPDSDTR